MNPTFAIVILAAGLGTRMKSRQAKVLHRAGGKTLIELVVATASRLADASRIFVVVGHQADRVRAVVAPLGVGFIDQPEQRGTGHAVMVGHGILLGAAPRLLVLYGDTPLIETGTLAGLMNQHVESGAAATVLTTRLDDPTDYGRILRGPSGDLLGIVEEKAATPEQRAIREINSGMYCFETKPLFECLAGVQPNNPAGEYYLTDVIECLRKRCLPVAARLAGDPTEVLGINTRVELAAVDALLRSRKTRELMLAGVTIEKPETVTIDAGVSIGADSVVEAFAQLFGSTTVGQGCRIGACSVIRDSTLEDDVTIEAFSWVNESRVRRGAKVGPYARLRTGNDVGPDARVGNFVELKKAVLGKGAKAQHLAYLGDTTIGGNVNIGAGTITCNFDGVAKHPTVIEDGVFVGSNSTLVAPLTIGAGAYVAAGSVVTEQVEPDALAIGRSRQTSKRGWAARRRSVTPAPSR